MYSIISASILKIHTGVGKMWGPSMVDGGMSELMILGSALLVVVMVVSVIGKSVQEFERDLNKEN